jgi:hypothetical protein
MLCLEPTGPVCQDEEGDVEMMEEGGGGRVFEITRQVCTETLFVLILFVHRFRRCQINRHGEESGRSQLI